MKTIHRPRMLNEPRKSPAPYIAAAVVIVLLLAVLCLSLAVLCLSFLRTLYTFAVVVSGCNSNSRFHKEIIHIEYLELV